MTRDRHEREQDRADLLAAQRLQGVPPDQPDPTKEQPMSNRRKPTRPVPLNPFVKPPRLPVPLGHIEWTDLPAADYQPRTLEWIASQANTQNRLNVWACETCGARVLCYDQHPGTTPMTVAHRTLGGDCPGTCRSTFYSGLEAAVVRDTQGGPTHQWYRPSADELRKASRHVRDHVMLGGLLVRAVEQEPTQRPPRPRERLFVLSDIADPAAPTLAELDAGVEIGHLL